MGLDYLRGDFNGVLKIRLCFCESIQVIKGPRSVVEARGVFRVESDGLVVVADGPVILLLLAPGDTAVVVRQRELRIKSDGLIQVADGPVDFFLLDPSAAAVGEGHREL